MCSLIVRSTIIKAKGFGQTITVTGDAFEQIKSDFANSIGIRFSDNPASVPARGRKPAIIARAVPDLPADDASTPHHSVPGSTRCTSNPFNRQRKGRR